MILESKYQLYLKEGTQKSALRIKLGDVFFERGVVVMQTKEGREIEIPIERTDNKNRERPDAHHRHGTKLLNEADSDLGLVDLRDFEWMAWNYRTYKSSNKFKSKEDMVAQMFNTTFTFLPSAEEILYGIIQA